MIIECRRRSLSHGGKSSRRKYVFDGCVRFRFFLKKKKKKTRKKELLFILCNNSEASEIFSQIQSQYKKKKVARTSYIRCISCFSLLPCFN